MRNITFKEVQNFLRKMQVQEENLFEKIINIASSLTDVSSSIKVFIKLLSCRGDLHTAGIKIYNMVVKTKSGGYISRIEQMRTAYALLCYSAFFDACDEKLPSKFRSNLSLQKNEKKMITESIYNRMKDDSDFDSVNAEELRFPYPFSHRMKTENDLLRIYNYMIAIYGTIIKDSLMFSEMNDPDRQEVREFLKSIPNIAINKFENQNQKLASDFNEFWIWLQMGKIDSLSVDLADYKYKLDKRIIDIGKEYLHNLDSLINSIPDIINKTKIYKVIERFRSAYEYAIGEKIVISKASSEKGELKYPTIGEVFVPQRFKEIHYTNTSIRLEQEGTWGNCEIFNDIYQFMSIYLSTPYSVESPLLILGHPGSGKSMLTKVLSNELINKDYVPILIPLRQVGHINLDIESLVLKQVKQDTATTFESWSDIIDYFPNQIVIFFDGYDELLQVSGETHADFLDAVCEFQKRQIIAKQAVRVFVTSRITLIDKAAIPIDSTIIRLMEFDVSQQKFWVKTWNTANPKAKFELPVTKSISELAKQPLLLLMLAIFDFEGGRITEQSQLSRADLYYNLAYNFAIREQKRYDTSYEYRDLAMQAPIIEKRLKLLGLVAMGMYNRNRLYILSSEIQSDLIILGCSQNIARDKQEFRLNEADSIIGSFFFIHVSRMDMYKDSSYEYLHNTFGDFFIAYNIIECMKNVVLENNTNQEWYVNLMCFPFHLKPVIIFMVQELFRSYTAKNMLNSVTFRSWLEIAIQKELNNFLIEPKPYPEIMISNYIDMPLVGLVANYTLNLVTIRTILYDEPFTIVHAESSKYSVLKRLNLLWRAWFNFKNLNSISNFIEIDSNAKRMIFKRRLQTQDISKSSNSSTLSQIIQYAEIVDDDLVLSMADVIKKQAKIPGMEGLVNFDIKKTDISL